MCVGIIAWGGRQPGSKAKQLVSQRKFPSSCTKPENAKVSLQKVCFGFAGAGGVGGEGVITYQWTFLKSHGVRVLKKYTEKLKG